MVRCRYINPPFFGEWRGRRTTRPKGRIWCGKTSPKNKFVKDSGHNEFSEISPGMPDTGNIKLRLPAALETVGLMLDELTDPQGRALEELQGNKHPAKALDAYLRRIDALQVAETLIRRAMDAEEI